MSEPTATETRSVKNVFGNGTAVITGAGSGLGAALAKHASAAGMHVVVADISRARAEAVAADINAAGGSAIGAYVDVTDLDSIKALARLTSSTFGEVTLLVNNAAVDALGFAWEIREKDWERVLRVNIEGVVHTTRIFTPAMISAGKPAAIVNLASIMAVGIGMLHGPYFISKHAVLSFSESLYMELREKAPHIAVSVVLPGPLATRFYLDVSGDTETIVREKGLADQIALGMQPAQAAEMVLSQVAAKKFWVSTHPELLLEWARHRAAYLSELANPDACPALV